MTQSSARDVIVAKNLAKAYKTWRSPSARLKSMARGKLSAIAGLSFNESECGYCTNFDALDDVDLRVREGECLGIIGRNGSGKSTLLKIVSGILVPTSGTLEVNGRVAALLELGTGFSDEFTGRENVYLNAAIFGVSRKQIDQRMAEIEEFAGIGDYMDCKVKTYSSGMLVRLAFSVMAHLEPDILIIDEALAVGDGAFVQKCMRWLNEFVKKHTAIIVSHDMAAITKFCTRAIWLEDGRVRYQGDPRVATEKYFEVLYESTNAKESEAEETAPDVENPANVSDARETDSNNQLSFFEFSPDAPSFGQDSARIVDVSLYDTEGGKIVTIHGGEVVSLIVTFRALRDIESPIIGVGVKNRLGQEIFHENTALNSLMSGKPPLALSAGDSAKATFKFRMPCFPSGEYFVFAAIATGTHEDHIQQHWCHEAVRFVSSPSRITLGLVGLPMLEIDIAQCGED